MQGRDLDELPPWLFLSLLSTGVLLILLQGPLRLAVPVRQLSTHESLVEIQLAPLPKKLDPDSPSLSPSLAPGGKIAQQNRQSSPAANTSRQRELAAYLIQWQSQILQEAKTQLGAGKIPMGKIVVAITLQPSGQLLSIHFIEGDPASPLAQAVRAIIVAAAPFPALPSAWQSPPQNLRIVRTWNFE